MDDIFLNFTILFLNFTILFLNFTILFLNFTINHQKIILSSTESCAEKII